MLSILLQYAMHNCIEIFANFEDSRKKRYLNNYNGDIWIITGGIREITGCSSTYILRNCEP